MSAWSAKTRRAPSRHCRYARVYGHTNTAMPDNEFTHPPYPPTHLLRREVVTNNKICRFVYIFCASNSHRRANHSNPLGLHSRFGDILLEVRVSLSCLCSAVLKGLKHNSPARTKCDFLAYSNSHNPPRPAPPPALKTTTSNHKRHSTFLLRENILIVIRTKSGSMHRGNNK